MDRITKLSRLVRYYLGFHILVATIMHFVEHLHKFTWTLSHSSDTFGKANFTVSDQTTNLFSLPLWQRLLVSIASAPTLILEILSMWSLMRLLKCYEGFEYFTVKTARYFKLIGIFAVCSEAAKVFQNIPVSYFLTFMNPPGERMINISLSTQNVSGIMLALVIILVGWVMERATTLQQESDATV